MLADECAAITDVIRDLPAEASTGAEYPHARIDDTRRAGHILLGREPVSYGKGGGLVGANTENPH
jgi:hypothetical protein